MDLDRKEFGTRNAWVALQNSVFEALQTHA